MEIEALITKMKDIYPSLIDFIEVDNVCDDKFKSLIQIIEKHAIFQNKEETQLLFQLLSKLADNHYRSSDFFDKLEQIFHYLIKDTPSPISYFIPDYTQHNKRVLFLLLEKNLLKPDSVEEFITYINRTNLSLLSKIKPSVYETHSLLIEKEPTLIEYAAFFGSIQIIQYLKYNKVPLTFSLWVYSIHSNNPELIHFLEENDVKPEKNSFRWN